MDSESGRLGEQASAGLLLDGLADGPDALLKGWLMDNMLSVSPQYAPGHLSSYILDEDAVQDTGPLLQSIRQPLDVVPDLCMGGDQQNMLVQFPAHAAAASGNAGTQQQQQQQQQRAAGANKGSAANAAKPRPKNTKRYKSQAQKDAHKRYRERKRQNITAMEAEVRAKLELLQQLEAENEQLKSKYRVLQTSYKCSTDIHQIMMLLDGVSLQEQDSSSTDSLPDLPSVSLATATATALTPGNSSWCTGGSCNSTSMCSMGGDAATPAATPAYSAAEAFSSENSRQVQAEGLVSDPTSAAGCFIKQEDTLNSSTSRSYSLDLTASAATGFAAPLYNSTSITGSSVHHHHQLAGAHSTGSEPGSSSLQAVCAEAQQQQQQQEQQQNAAGVLEPPCSAGAGDSEQLELVASVEQGLRLYKDFLAQAQMLMLKQEVGDQEAAAAAEEELCQLTRSIISRMQPFLVAQGQGLVYDWNSRNIETLCYQDAPDELWPKVLALMRLSPEQQQDALACNRMFSICLSKLVDKRAQLTANYKALQQRAEVLAARCKEEGEVAGDVQLRAELMGASMEALQSIAQNLAAYQSLDGVFAHSITSIITGAQMAVAMVHSYPFLPQWHQLMRHLQLQVDAATDRQQQQQAARQLSGRRSGRATRASQIGMQHVVQA